MPRSLPSSSVPEPSVSAPSRGARPYAFLRALLALGVLGIGLLYTYIAVYLAPYSGIDLSPNWVVRSIEPCDADPDWCRTNRNRLRPGDQILAIGDLSRAQALADRGRVMFGGLEAGERVEILRVRDGEAAVVEWEVLGPTPRAQFARLTDSIVLFLPFWVAGSIVLLLLKPRDRRWRLLIAFNYLTAIWLVVGAFSYLQVAYTSPSQRALAWLLVPVYLHLHTSLPTPRFAWLERRVLPALYGAAAVFALGELFQWLTVELYIFALLIALLGSATLLFLRLLPGSPAEGRSAALLMVVGIVVGLGPGVLLTLLPTFLQVQARDQIILVRVTIFAVPLLPAFYVYAIYKPYLSKLEFGVNRLLSTYTFNLLYLTLLMVALASTSSLSAGAWEALLLIVAIFIIAAPHLQARFQRLVDRVAYGPIHDPKDVNRAFADQLPAANERSEIVRLLVDELLPSLAIRQSALYLLRDNGSELVYAQNMEPLPPEPRAEVMALMEQGGRYRPPTRQQGPFSWVRLAIPLQVRGEPIGVWLFGRRTPDNFYPQAVVGLLTTLGKQVAVALENVALFQHLEQRSHELATSLEQQRFTQAQLVQAGKLASLGTLTAGIAHELNNPLAGMKLYVQNLLRMQRSGTLQGEVLEETLASVNKLIDKSSRIIANFRTFSRQASDDPRPFAVEHAVEDALGLMGEQLRMRGIEVELDVAENLPPVYGDQIHLEQVLVNLISNARDAMCDPPAAERVLTMRCGVGDDGVFIEVGDTGSGVPPEVAEKIFDPFFTTKEPGKGTGLGLSISYGIIQSLGGSIQVETRPAGGTIFRMVLPVYEPVAITQSAQPRTQA